MTRTVFWPTLLGLSFLGAGMISYRRDLRGQPREAFGLAALGPVFMAAALAAFAGEHFTAATSLAALVPKWLPARVFIACFVGVAHLSAALSFVARRFMRWSTIALAVMFALFVLLMDLPAAIARPANPLSWMLAARQATFAIGALALFAIEVRTRLPQASRTIAVVARVWTGTVLVAYGVQHLVHPEYAPGVPSPVRTAAWVPFPVLLAYGTGSALIVLGVLMIVRRSASAAAALCGVLMLLLTVALYGPDFFLAQNPQEQITAVNFIFDTLLFAGTVLVISRAVSLEESPVIAGPSGTT